MILTRFRNSEFIIFLICLNSAWFKKFTYLKIVGLWEKTNKIVHILIFLWKVKTKNVWHVQKIVPTKVQLWFIRSIKNSILFGIVKENCQKIFFARVTKRQWYGMITIFTHTIHEYAFRRLLCYFNLFFRHYHRFYQPYL